MIKLKDSVSVVKNRLVFLASCDGDVRDPQVATRNIFY